ncbi:probable protein phosphatase 2C 76 [Olea europaea var. sylvestris]|uniref:probable protein phosphatase 2C 76 n=1 Tax=Olea europaea var. sylvestris TaxID=158386 RepID=UPI000C1D1558|nr:probable protein phosphatase 2C 76 [Olea europaea var. sylvestris]
MRSLLCWLHVLLVDIYQIILQDQEIDQELELLVLASDGLWDVVPNEDAISLAQIEDEPKAAARKLTETAFTRGSADNITCIVVRFHHETTVPEETHQSFEANYEETQQTSKSNTKETLHTSESQQTFKASTGETTKIHEPNPTLHTSKANSEETQQTFEANTKETQQTSEENSGETSKNQVSNPDESQQS